MKYLVSLFLIATPLLTSCDVQDDYYDQGPYYNPPPRVQVDPYYDARNYHQHGGYHRGPQGGVYHGHGNQAPVAVDPRGPRPQMRPQQNNVHGHNGNVNQNVHGHGDVQQNVHRHQESKGNVHGHDDEEVQAAQNVPVPQNTHGHH